MWDAIRHNDILRAALAVKELQKYKKLYCLVEEGKPPLIYACKRGCIDVATLLLDAGASVDAKDDQGDRITKPGLLGRYKNMEHLEILAMVEKDLEN